MVKKYFKFIKESLVKKEESEISIDAHDYLETWECTLKDRYRNVDTGELKRLNEIFDIPKYVWMDKYIGIFDKDQNFKIINLGYDIYRRRILDQNQDHTLHIKNVVQKNRQEFLVLHVGEEFQKKVMKPHGKGKYWKMKTGKPVVVNKIRFTICKLYEYCNDFRNKFAGRRVEVTTEREQREIFRVPSKDLWYNDNVNLDIHTYGDQYLYFHTYTYGGGFNNKNLRVNVFQPAISRKYYINPTVDPYGEEDWDIDD
jgi:hypothetical protein